ncbi:MAG: DUF3592 domain-containing protein [Candidatus Heimdallarchaeota archaeon]|nr:DUF3592 domain-containing protein [Candidatus Heimdallarchaeota archaeon]
MAYRYVIEKHLEPYLAEYVSNQMSIKTKLLLILIAFPIPGSYAIAGIILIFRNAIEGIRSARWPSIQGVITVSHLDRSGGSVNHNFLYHYVIVGTLYSSSRKNIGGWGLSGVNDRDKIKQFPPRSLIDVYYDPDKPQKAVVKPGLQISNFLSIIFLPFAIIPQLILPYFDISMIFNLL